eukprot:15460968-Alexandrium_andersonii.AAC.1
MGQEGMGWGGARAGEGMCVCVMPLHATCSALAHVASATSARPGGAAAPFRCALEASFAGSGGWEEAVALQGGVPGQAVLRLHQLSFATILASGASAPARRCMAEASRGSAASAASAGEQDKEEEEEGEGTKSEGEEKSSSSKSAEAAEAFKEEQRCQTKGATGRWA